jgi:hypothetical protein
MEAPKISAHANPERTPSCYSVPLVVKRGCLCSSVLPVVRALAFLCVLGETFAFLAVKGPLCSSVYPVVKVFGFRSVTP